MNIKVENYYNLAELVFGMIEEDWPEDVTPSQARDNNITWADFLEGMDYYAYDSWGYADVLFQDFVWPRFYRELVLKSKYRLLEGDEHEEEREKFIKDFKKWQGKVYVWLISSCEHYGPMISKMSESPDFYAGAKGKIFTRFNDTPQTTAGVLDTDTYATNTTKTDTEQDTKPIIEKMAEVEALLHSYYEAWAKEFERFVIDD